MSSSYDYEEMGLVKKKYYDIFISYHQKQFIEVDHFSQQLRKYNFRIWYNLNSSKSYGRDIFDTSIDALRDSYLFICFFSHDYCRSCYCRAELALAIEQNMSILNVIVDNNSFNYQDNSFELSNSIYSEIRLYEVPDYSQIDINFYIDLIKELVYNEILNTQSAKTKVKLYYESLKKKKKIN